MSNKKVSDIMIEVLEQAGVQHCYGIVGDTLNHFTDSLSRSSISWINVRHEEVGAFAAGADALFSGRLTVCAGSCGPGSLHFMNGLFESNKNGSPIVLIASQLSTEQTGYIDFPQYVDFKEIYKSCSVYCEEIKSPNQIRHIMTIACQTAINKRGVAVVIMPSNISQQYTDDVLPFRVHQPNPQTIPTPEELAQICQILESSNKVTIYAGIGCQYAHDEVVQLAEKLNAPVVHTSRAKDFIEYDNPYNLGMNGLYGNKAAVHAIMNCDVLLLLGTDFAWPQFYAKKAKIVQIDIDPTHLGRRYPIEFGAVGHINPTLRTLLPMLQANPQREFWMNILPYARKASLYAAKKSVSVKMDSSTHNILLPYLIHMPMMMLFLPLMQALLKFGF